MVDEVCCYFSVGQLLGGCVVPAEVHLVDAIRSSSSFDSSILR